MFARAHSHGEPEPESDGTPALATRASRLRARDDHGSCSLSTHGSGARARGVLDFAGGGRPRAGHPRDGRVRASPALPDQPPSISGLLASESFRAANPAVGVHAVPLRLGDAVQRSLANVQTIQANIAVRTATVARFEALSSFVPLMTLPQFMSGFSRFTPTSAGSIIDFPEVMGFTQFSGQAPGSTTSRRAGCSSSCRSILPARFFPCRWPRKESVPRC